MVPGTTQDRVTKLLRSYVQQRYYDKMSLGVFGHSITAGALYFIRTSTRPCHSS